jgi:hypothetical protein
MYASTSVIRPRKFWTIVLVVDVPVIVVVVSVTDVTVVVVVSVVVVLVPVVDVAVAVIVVVVVVVSGVKWTTTFPFCASPLGSPPSPQGVASPLAQFC